MKIWRCHGGSSSGRKNPGGYSIPGQRESGRACGSRPWKPLYLESCYITPEFDDKCVCFEYNLSKCKASAVEFSIAFEGKFAACVNVVPNGRKGMVKVQLDQTGLRSWNFEEELAWTPETPPSL